MLKISTAPHMSSSVDTSVIMRDVIIALLPAVLVSLLFFGLSAVVVLLTSGSANMQSAAGFCTNRVPCATVLPPLPGFSWPSTCRPAFLSG